MNTFCLIFSILQDLVIVVLFILGIGRKKERTSTYNSVASLPRSIFWVGMVAAVTFSIPNTLVGPEKMTLGTWFVFEGFILLSLLLVIAYYNIFIHYDKNGFEISNILGIKKRYSYKDITEKTCDGGDMILYVGKKKIYIDIFGLEGMAFMSFAGNAYSRIHNKDIPDHICKNDPMNGNLSSPWVMFFLNVFLFLGGIFLLIISLYFAKPIEIREGKDLIAINVTFSSYEVHKENDGTIYLYSQEYKKPFTISFLSGYEVSIPAPDSFIEGNNYTVTAHEYRKYYCVYAISDAKGDILSADDYYIAYRNSQRFYTVLMILFSIVIMLSAVFSIIVGRHPERFPIWVRRLFYKDYIWKNNR